LNKPDGQKLMLDFVRSQRPDPTANTALLELANYYYNDHKYDEAIEMFAMLDTRGMNTSEQQEIRFKHAYCLFVTKRFDEAKAKFSSLTNEQGPYYDDSNYYFGLTSFYSENYDDAISSWTKIQGSARYRKLIPYYIAQIYFAQGSFQEVVSYAESFTTERGIKNLNEINQLVGQAYFELGDYEEALPFLEYYEERSRRLREEDFYQLAYVQYHNGKFEASIENFRELDKTNTELGQSAMYYLADAYLKTGDKASARNAFLKVTRFEFNDELREEALFHYARLSTELHFDRDAVNAYTRFEPTSKHYTRAQELLSETLVNTKDYKAAIRIIEGMDTPTPRIKEAYQKVTYYQGLEDYTQRRLESGLSYFAKSLKVPIDIRITALATFWTGEIHYLQDRNEISKTDFSSYLSLAKRASDLPPTSSIPAAHYTQGYNYLKTNDYSTALKHFASSIDGIKSASSGDGMMISQILPDAYLRAGDCNFKRNSYAEALKHYDQAIGIGAPGFEYALFQKAIIQGLRNRNDQKLIALEELIRAHPNSAYADDALYEMGETYQSEGRYREALDPFEKLVSDYRGKSELINRSYLKLGLITYNLGDIERALAYYKRIFQNNPSSKEAKDALAAIEEIYVEDLGQPDEYVAFVESIPGYKISGGERDSLNYIVAERHYENANYEEAIVAFTDYIRKYPNGLQIMAAHYNRAESQAIIRKYDEALEDYEWVLNRGDSRYYQRSLEKAALICYNHAEAFNKAFQYFSQLESLASDPDVKFQAQLGSMRSAYRTGRKEAASAYASKVMSNPKATREELAVAEFFRGKIAYEDNKYDEALALFTSVIEKSDNEHTAEARYLRAAITFLKEQIDDAESLCRAAYTESAAYPYWVA
ncbi:MAG: tetratricopeptide repeat protein, partial [Saprospiraceae bacterium]|nr:tetratricopeptide repeat protein [Saprospiraceae bacterium]